MVQLGGVPVNLTLEAVLLGDPSEPENRMLDYMIAHLTKDALHAVPHVRWDRRTKSA